MLKRKKILNNFKKIKIKTSSLGTSHIIILISLLLLLVSLLNPWVRIWSNWNTYGAFSSITWISGFLSVIIIILNLFVIFSKNLKQKITQAFGLYIKNSNIFLFSSLLILIIGIHTIVSLNSLTIFSSEIIFHSGIIFFLVGSIFFIFWSIMSCKSKNGPSDTFLTNSSNDSPQLDTNVNKKTTKLPF